METKSFVVSKIGTVQQLKGDKFVQVGRISVGNDAKGRLKAIMNINDEIYSSFLNDQMTEQDRKDFEDWKKSRRR